MSSEEAKVEVTLNGEPRVLAKDATVNTAFASLDLPIDGRGIAVAINEEVVPRSLWSSTVIPAGARIEIVRAIQGG
jgi:sulfur carrier protein